MEVVAVNQTLLSLSAHCTQDDCSNQECVYTRVCECTRASVCVCRVSLWLVFFPLQVVLSTCLCSWPPSCESKRFGDEQGGGLWLNKPASSVSVSLSPLLEPSSLILSVYFSSSLICHSYFLVPFVSRPHLFLCSLSLCLPFYVSLSFHHHKHFQCWHSSVRQPPENSATTITSTLTSHNNARITCWRDDKVFFECNGFGGRSTDLVNLDL